MHIARDALIEDVMVRGGIPDRASAETVLEVALEAVAGHLASADRQRVAQELPAPFAAAMTRPGQSPAVDAQDLPRRIATTEEISLGQAVEYLHAACGTLAEQLDGETRDLLVRRLPADWAALFADAAAAATADLPRGVQPGHGHSLATGRAGSLHPVAEAAPPGAHAESVVTAANPHGDSKLSSSRGPGPANPLATGHSGSEHPIADATDERRGR